VTDFLATPATGGSAPGGFGADEFPRASYTLRVNGVDRPVLEAWIGESLLYVLRERLGLAGAKDGCDQGECGACSVQLDGQLTAACLVPAALAADSEIRTVEGLAQDGVASDVQRALAESGAVQCGYCVPGLAMAVHDLLERNHQPTELEAREALCGNLCRCTGYRGALAAVQTVAESRAEQAESGDDADAAGADRAAAPAAAPGPGPAPVEQTGAEPVYQEPGHQAAPGPQPLGLPEPGFAEPVYQEQQFAEAPYPGSGYPEPVYAETASGYADPAHAEQQSYGEPAQQSQPQYEYQATTGHYPAADGGYAADPGPRYVLPHQQSPAAPEAGA